MSDPTSPVIATEPSKRLPWVEPELTEVDVVDNTGNNGGPGDEGFGSGG